MPYLGRSPTQAVRARYYYTVASGATSVTGSDDNSNTLIFSDGEFVDVSLNGVTLVAGTDYVTSTANTIGSLSAMSANDVVEVVVYDVFSVFDGNVNSDFSVGGDLAVTGKVGIGTSSPSATLQVEGTTNGLQSVFGLDSSGLKISTFAKTGNDAGVVLDAQESSNGTLTFASTGTERMRIDSSGNVGIGIAPTFTAGGSRKLLQVTNAANGGQISMGNNSSESENPRIFSDADSLGFATATTGGGVFQFFTGGSERMRLAGGELFIGKTSESATTNGFQIKSSGEAIIGRAANDDIFVFQDTASGGTVGRISITASNTSYNTSSDYRLKENVVTDWDATSRLKQLKPSRFNFKVDADTTVDGFLAHEVSSIVPEAIQGAKDATRTVTNGVFNSSGSLIAEGIEKDNWTAGKLATKDAEDNDVAAIYPSDSTWSASKDVPVYQGIDQSKLVPLLVKTIQELEARIKTLEDA